MDKIGQPNIKNLPITDEELRYRIQEGFKNLQSKDKQTSYNAYVDLEFYKREVHRLGKTDLFDEEQIAYLWARRGFFLERSNV